MTEQEWLACTNARPMLGHLSGRASDRKLRLFACTCVRRVWDLLPGEPSKRAVQAGEGYADQSINLTALQFALRIADDAAQDCYQDNADDDYEPYSRAAVDAAFAAAGVSKVNAADAALAFLSAAHAHAGITAYHSPAEDWGDDYPSEWLHREIAADAEKARQCDILRDIIGNPFRPVAFNTAWSPWNNGTVSKLAQAAYDDRQLPSGHLDAVRLAILADALEEAGCQGTAILEHCRGPGPHVRGCWALDLILGKE